MYPFRQPINYEDSPSNSDSSNWEPPDYFKVSEQSNKKWEPPDYFKPKEEKKKEEKPNLFQKAKEFFTPPARMDITKAISANIPDSVKRFVSGVEAVPRSIYESTKNIGKESSEQLKSGDVHGAFQTIFSPLMGPIDSVNKMLEGKATGKDIQLPSKKEATEEGISQVLGMAGLPGKEVIDAYKQKDYAKLAGMGLTAAAIGGLAHYVGGEKRITERSTERVSKEIPYKMVDESTQPITKEEPPIRQAPIETRPLPTRSPNLAAEFTTPEEVALSQRQPGINKEDIKYNIARKKFNMGWEPPDYFKSAEETTIETPKPTAKFVFDWPEAGGRMYNIEGGEYDRSTVTERRLKELGIDVPEVSDEDAARITKQRMDEKEAAQKRMRNPFAKSSQETTKLPDITEGFGGAGHPEDPEYVGKVLKAAGVDKEKPGLSTEPIKDTSGNVANLNAQHIVYRNNNGEPIAVAKIVRDQQGNNMVMDLAADKSKGLLTGRAMKAIGDILVKLKATKAAGTMSPDAENFVERMKRRQVPENFGKLKPEKTMDEKLKELKDYSVEETMPEEFKKKQPNIAEKLTSKAQEFEDKAIERIKQRGTFSGSRLGAGLPADDLADLAIVGASRIAKGAIRFSDWSVQMIKDFGERIRPYLADIFRKSQDKHMELHPEDPINRLAKVLDQSKPLEKLQANIYSAERAKRIGQASNIKTSGEQGFYEQLSKLKGEHTKIHFLPLRDKLTQPEIDHLFDTVTKSNEDEFGKINAKEAITAVLRGDIPQANQIDLLERVFGREFPTLRKMRTGPDDFLTKLANFSSKTTRAVLGFHIPGTAISFHGFNEAIRNTIFGPDFNPINAAGRFADVTHYLARPKAAQEFLDINADSLNKAIKEGGLKVATGDIGLTPMFEGRNILTRGFNALTDPKPLFGQVIPALKLKSYEGLLKQYEGQGISHSQAAKMAGYATNNIFGGLNLRELQRSPITQKLFRSTFLAPDWLESNIRLGKGMFDAIKKPGSAQNRVYMVGMTNFLGSYIALNILNAINNDGRFSFQNEVGHEFDVAIGRDSAGRVRYFSPYGTAMDMFRIPLQVAHAAAEGNVGRSFTDLRSRISEPLQFMTDMITNTNYIGQPLYDKDKYGHPMNLSTQGKNIVSDAAGHFLPIGIEAGANLTQGKISPEQFASQVLQVPMKYKFPERPKSRFNLKNRRLTARR